MSRMVYGTKGRVLGTIFGLFVVGFGAVSILFSFYNPGRAFIAVPFGGVMTFVGLRELRKVYTQPDYSIEITQGSNY
ncbi:hypothetical protein [Haloarcula salinisoli]|uniref:Uncharacterized protein n=1 Tax=Haloarcula salinisoli TaxID=2487746 RepID=A0A8J8C7R7_9EURY|nr:hypothetical protein [Halomicroarcula salinisoli]MBX0284940.1 hypothetical protein [Halomicroarcula salinisoli]MBX0303582.1 hypothetical protein [Halomicroarcula salinisoli]